jgi:hypothetical protein
MLTNTYLVHDSETGEVVLAHVEPAELESAPDEILRLAGSPAGSRLVAVRVTDGSAELPARVIDGAPHPEDSPNWGHASISAGPAEPALPRRYVAE